MERETAGKSTGETTSATDGLEQLQRLEKKIHQTIDLLKSTRAENERLRREREALEARLARFEKEREAVRGRVQKLLEQVDSLTNPRPEA